MSKRTFWRLLLTLAACTICTLFVVKFPKIHLGLDLRGGVHFELEVQAHEALESDFRDMRDRLMDKLREKGQTMVALRLDGDSLKVEGLSTDAKASVEKVVKEFAPGYTIQEQGGVTRLLQTEDHKRALIDDAGKRALQIIENRINQFGVAEPEITQAGADGTRIVVELPGVEEGDRERIKALLATPGRLEQHILANPDDHKIFFDTREEGLAHFNGTIPDQYELLPDIEEPHGTRKEGQPKPKEPVVQKWVLLESKVGMDGADIIEAYAEPGPNGIGNAVHFTLNHKGAEDFSKLTGVASEENRQMAIVLDRKVTTILGAQEKLYDSAQITGSFSPTEAEDLARTLRSGAMKASMRFLEQTTVGPSLGRDSIHKGMVASLVGFGTIVLFMILFYKLSGLNAIVALTVNVFLMLGLLAAFGATLTLPGIAGFALTIGMAVDANILIFERIKEELGLGRSVTAAIDAGFDKAFWTIVDAHVTQMVAALFFALGPFPGTVKGFGVTLAIGVAASLFTSIYMSRFIYDWILERHPGTKTISI